MEDKVWIVSYRDDGENPVDTICFEEETAKELYQWYQKNEIHTELNLTCCDACEIFPWVKENG